ncbi:BAR/IMD domain-containing adapter protein 2-like 2 isoform X2 [Carettochelys insculpta]|uniref:BAR/IMD domain-containing adapter protein 2-like 2 isoform X2 n=1 Tax=Carettochelys insculpta TaxID=44489 RepID=UPI003EBEEA00
MRFRFLSPLCDLEGSPHCLWSRLCSWQSSCQRYELEYRHRAANLEKCMSDLWRMERTRDKNAWEMKENVKHLHSEMQAFVSESQRAAELEEKRRYRFLAEKHQLLSSTFLQAYSRAWSTIQSKVPRWKEQLEASRNPSSSHTPSLFSASPSQGYLSGRLTPSHLDKPQRPLGDFGSALTGHSSSPFRQESAELLRPSPQPETARRGLPRTSSAGSLSRSSSFGEPAGREAGGGGRALRVQAIVPHSAGANHTLLGFNMEDVVTVLSPEAQNGWLYGRLEGSSASGWFPEAFVKPLGGVRDPEEPPTRAFPLRSSRSTDGHLDRPSVPTAGNYRPSAASPQLPNPSPASLGAGSRRGSTTSAAPSESKKSAVQDQPPEFFPRGTNPFATVKLRPTVTNDRSAPLIR